MHTQLSELLRWGEYVPLEPCSKSIEMFPLRIENERHAR